MNIPTGYRVRGQKPLEQIRTIDKQRLKQYMGMMPNSIMARVDKALAISVSLKGGQNG